MQINTRLSLGHHWALASASVVPVAPHCTCGSSGLPVYSNYANWLCIAIGKPLGDSISVVPVQSVQWYPSVLRASGLEVIWWGHFAACSPIFIQLVWRKLFELSWFHWYCNPKYTKTITVLISKACTGWFWSTHTFEKQNWYAAGSSKLHVKAGFTETCPLVACCPVILSIQAGMDATLLNYMWLGVCALLLSLQWCSSVCCNSQSFSSGIPVWVSFT